MHREFVRRTSRETDRSSHRGHGGDTGVIEKTVSQKETEVSEEKVGYRSFEHIVSWSSVRSLAPWRPGASHLRPRRDLRAYRLKLTAYRLESRRFGACPRCGDERRTSSTRARYLRSVAPWRPGAGASSRFASVRARSHHDPDPVTEATEETQRSQRRPFHRRERRKPRIIPERPRPFFSSLSFVHHGAFSNLADRPPGATRAELPSAAHAAVQWPRQQMLPRSGRGSR